MNWNKLLLVLIFDIIFLQGNYQLLTVPHNFNNIFKIDQFAYDKKVSFFHLMFPGDIILSSITFPISQKKNRTFGFHTGFPLNISMLLNGIPM